MDSFDRTGRSWCNLLLDILVILVSVYQEHVNRQWVASTLVVNCLVDGLTLGCQAYLFEIIKRRSRFEWLGLFLIAWFFVRSRPVACLYISQGAGRPRPVLFVCIAMRARRPTRILHILVLFSCQRAGRPRTTPSLTNPLVIFIAHVSSISVGSATTRQSLSAV